MRVLITGVAGLIGRVVAEHLQSAGWDVHAIDIATPAATPDFPYVVCDIMNFEDIRAQMQGCDAVVHMAALRNPFYGPGEEIFRINTAGTFNVFEAAAQAGIQRVVQASSINAFGCAWNTGDFSPQYLPVDEDHPAFTTDPYSFSKQIVEDIGAYYWRRENISSIALRLPGIYKSEMRHTPQAHERRQNMRHFLDAVTSLPADEQQMQLDQVRQACLAFRGSRQLEYPHKTGTATTPKGIDPLLWQAYVFDRYNLWASLSVEDAARVVEKSLTASYEGSHNLFVNNRHNSLDYDSAALAGLFFPGVTFKRPLTGSESLVNVQRVRDLIGFEPQPTP